jgi:NAD(P)H dehydrogenase (quinone)
MKLIISGASGDLGRKVTALVLQQRPSSDLILLTRNPTSLSDETSRGATVRQADFSDPSTLTKAMQGGDVLLLISTLSIGKRAQQHANAINAAKAAGVKHIIYTSSCGIQPQTPSISGQEHYATEQVLQKSGLTYTILRNSWYADVTPMFLLPAGLAKCCLRNHRPRTPHLPRPRHLAKRSQWQTHRVRGSQSRREAEDLRLDGRQPRLRRRHDERSHQCLGQQRDDHV